MQYYLICYDIADDNRLYLVHKDAYALALGGQKSAFEAPLRANEAIEILHKLTTLIDEDEDKINIIEVEGEPLYLGVRPMMEVMDGVILI